MPHSPINKHSNMTEETMIVVAKKSLYQLSPWQNRCINRWIQSWQLWHNPASLTCTHQSRCLGFHHRNGTWAQNSPFEISHMMGFCCQVSKVQKDRFHLWPAWQRHFFMWLHSEILLISYTNLPSSPINKQSLIFSTKVRRVGWCPAVLSTKKR